MPQYPCAAYQWTFALASSTVAITNPVYAEYGDCPSRKPLFFIRGPMISPAEMRLSRSNSVSLSLPGSRPSVTPAAILSAPSQSARWLCESSSPGNNVPPPPSTMNASAGGGSAPTATMVSRKTPTLAGAPTLPVIASKTRTLVNQSGPLTRWVSLVVNVFNAAPDSSPASAESSAKSRWCFSSTSTEPGERAATKWSFRARTN